MSPRKGELATPTAVPPSSTECVGSIPVIADDSSVPDPELPDVFTRRTIADEEIWSCG